VIRRTIAPLLTAALALTAVACGGGGSNISSSSSSSSSASASATTTAGGAATSAHRGGTLTMLWSGAGTSIDTANDYDQNWFILRMTSDGLLAYRQVGGAPGNQLVPDLATAIPVPTDSGRTYVVHVRSGIKFSTGRTVKPSDFVYTYTREFKIPGPGTGFFSHLVGGATCLKSPKKCDLSRGVVADDAAGTLTFHLSEVDPNFLQELASPFGYVVPAGTPNHDVGSKPLPATGPYEIQSYTPNQQIIFVRNPDFKQWSSAAQPDGYPNRIVMKLGLPLEDATTEVEKGEADWMYDNPPTDRLNEVATKYPSQIHINSTPQVYYMGLNTRVAPFDNISVRRALNYATDRSAVVSLFGGPRLAQTTCQTLPPNFPGYAPYCPYTANPGSGKWTGPDLAKAKQLVAASHTAGQRVAVITTPDDTTKNISLYFVSLLDKLGYRASLKTLSSSVEYSYVQNSQNKPQISLSYWSPDYNAASNFLSVSVGCAGFTAGSTASPNLSEFCDPAIQKLTARALRVQTTNPSAANPLWAAIDKAVTDQAPEVPLFVAGKLDFVAKRVGNYQFNPSVTGRFMIDQAWVK
jgi:peptide/nickel transport system substrate-binding protein